MCGRSAEGSRVGAPAACRARLAYFSNARADGRVRPRGCTGRRPTPLLRSCALAAAQRKKTHTSVMRVQAAGRGCVGVPAAARLDYYA